jgi:hypothetical protein
MKSPLGTGGVVHVRNSNNLIRLQLLGTGEKVSWRGLRCTVQDVHLVWLAANLLSCTSSYYLMENLSSTFNVSFRELHFG